MFATLGYVGNQDDEGEDPTPPAWMPATALTGLVMTPLSWMMFGRTFKPGVNVEPRSRRAVREHGHGSCRSGRSGILIIC